MEKCTLIIGGARSGKSQYALNICRNIKKKIFLATAQPIDEEMKERIERHKKERDPNWITVEEPVYITEKIKELDREDSVILLDCVTLWLNNLFMHNMDIEKEISSFIETLLDIKGKIVIISNEIGMGIVPKDELSRRYRDLLGYINQQLAKIADKVILMVAGIPVIIKS